MEFHCITIIVAVVVDVIIIILIIIFIRLLNNNTVIMYGCITNSNCDQLPVGFIAQLVEHCTSIAQFMGLNPVQPEFFQALISLSSRSFEKSRRLWDLINIISSTYLDTC